MTKAEFADHMNRFRDSIPGGISVNVTGVTAEGDRVAVEAESIATMPNGRTLNQVYHFLFEFEDGKVRRARSTWTPRTAWPYTVLEPDRRERQLSLPTVTAVASSVSSSISSSGASIPPR